MDQSPLSKANGAKKSPTMTKPKPGDLLVRVPSSVLEILLLHRRLLLGLLLLLLVVMLHVLLLLLLKVLLGQGRLLGRRGRLGCLSLGLGVHGRLLLRLRLGLRLRLVLPRVGTEVRVLESLFAGDPLRRIELEQTLEQVDGCARSASQI